MNSKPQTINTRIDKLRQLVAYHRQRYHLKDAPEISDEAYDSLVEELRILEGGDEDNVLAESNQVGGDTHEAFSKVKHVVRQWSFSNIFSFIELTEWINRIERLATELDLDPATLSYICEHKIDGLKLVLEYKAGVLVRAATRGNGVVGEDVTHTARTIADLPTTLPLPVDLICVGEVWLSQKEFTRINKEREAVGEPLFANPRNAAAGSLRQLDPAVSAARKLSLFCYDIDAFSSGNSKVPAPTAQEEELNLLAKLNLPTNNHWQLCQNVAEIQAYYEKWMDKSQSLPYGVDGIVIKVNSVSDQRALGYTAKSPRFGVAYKFPAEQATTVVEDIQLQVGRTGTITPVAHLRPVLIDGSVVSRATLHNEDEIKRLDVRIGDTVILEKAGDVIPKVLSVMKELRPEKTKPFRFPKTVLGCGGDGRIERVPGEAAYRCVTIESDYLHRQRLYHFVSKHALNMDGVGPRIIDLLLDHSLIDTYPDLFTLEVGDLKDLPGFKERAAENVVSAIAASRSVPLYRLLVGLSIDGVGEETARLLANTFGTLERIQAATEAEVVAIHGIGDTVAESLLYWMKNPKNQALLMALKPYLNIESGKSRTVSSKLSGKTVVFTGTLLKYTRDEAKELARSLGATVASSVSRKTDYVVVGESAGSKAAEAEALGVTVLSEAEFTKLAAS